MIDLDVVGKKYGPLSFEYTWKEAVLYALGIGAQAEELPFVYENVKGGLKVFPSFSIVMGSPLWKQLFRDMKNVDLSRFIHGEQGIKLYRPIPPEGKTLVEGGITNIYDKGKGAVFIWRMKVMAETGDLLAETESGIFYVGEGGFGGDPGPKAEALEPPKGTKPDFAVSYFIPRNQAALYRLCGDTNPLHLDPDFAKRGGFSQPILHGLCTYGHAVRAILYSTCHGEVERFKEFKGRLSGVVYPGDTLIIEGWKDKGGRYFIQCRTDRGVVLSHAYARVE